jgi:4-amino-4-deoxy-L-arabinose transferase-like glycosyltransferase
MHTLRFHRAFWTVWLSLLLLKAATAWQLPLFGDEAWYWLEGQHLAAAYSDLPGLTAWLARLGVEVAGHGYFGLRLPFLCLGMAIPLLLRASATRRFGAAAGDVTGLLALGLPLLGSAGVLALPDVPLTFAAALCLHAGLRLCERVEPRAIAWLALGLAIGALSHYRFALIAAAGALGLLLDRDGRRALRDPRTWPALVVGLLAWWPLLQWNLAHAAAGVSFQLGERHPWQLHAEGFWLPLSQLAVVGPFLLAVLLGAMLETWRRWRETPAAGWGLLLASAALPLVFYLVLACFADRERVSFHWLLQAWLPLLVVAPLSWQRWSRGLRHATLASSALLLAAAFGYLALAILPSWRQQFADSQAYPENFAGWEEIAAALRDDPAVQADSVLLADNFMLGAQLGFALHRRDIAVLDHPLNHKHGRAAQLALWGLDARLDRRATTAGLLVMEDTAIQLRRRLEHYQRRCREAGSLSSPRVLPVDHGRKRFLLFALPSAAADGGCRLPAVAWLDAPRPGATLTGARAPVSGWAFKDGAGIARVDLTLDGRVVATAQYGLHAPHVAEYWRVSRDAAHPDVGFEAELPLGGVTPGAHWLGLVLHGRDGSREAWAEQRVRVER